MLGPHLTFGAPLGSRSVCCNACNFFFVVSRVNPYSHYRKKITRLDKLFFHAFTAKKKMNGLPPSLCSVLAERVGQGCLRAHPPWTWNNH